MPRNLLGPCYSADLRGTSETRAGVGWGRVGWGGVEQGPVLLTGSLVIPVLWYRDPHLSSASAAADVHLAREI